MLTIKLNIAGSILISQSPEVSIGLKGSDLFHSVLSTTGWPCDPLDAVQMFPETFDGEGHQLTEEMIINIPRPAGLSPAMAMAVLITDVSAPEQPGITGTNYQFIYPGDEADVLNENGISVHHIK